MVTGYSRRKLLVRGLPVHMPLRDWISLLPLLCSGLVLIELSSLGLSLVGSLSRGYISRRHC